jgi:hypothetical protein
MELEIYWQQDYRYDRSHRNYFDHIKQQELASQLCFIVESTILQTSAQDLPELVTRCAKETGRFPVLCLDGNPIDIFPILKSLKDLDPGSYFVLGPDIRSFVYNQPNVAPWPVFLFEQQIEPEYQQAERRHRISFLSGIPRFHRIHLAREIRSYIRDTDVVVVNKFTSPVYEQTIPPWIPRLEALAWLDELPWSNNPGYFDSDQSALNAHCHGTNRHPAYSAYVNITGETLYGDDPMFITEKTWKAYRSGCLVINYGPTNLPSFLQHLGFRIWDEYDVDAPADAKIEQIKQVFQLDDIEEIYHHHRDMIAHNQELVRSKHLIDVLTKPAIDKLLSLVK